MMSMTFTALQSPSVPGDAAHTPITKVSKLMSLLKKIRLEAH
jgi:hypothetical protein